MPPPSADEIGRFRRLDAAFRNGDLAAIRSELDDADGFPNIAADAPIGPCLVYAIYVGPLDLVAGLLDAGADPNWPADDGFPPLIAALSCSANAHDTEPGTATRSDTYQLLELLLARGASLEQRGVNDYTPLHWAASTGDLAAIDLFLAHGADPNAITRIDDHETALELAQSAGHRAIVDRLAPLTSRPDWERASKNGDLATLRKMHRNGHNINATDGYSQTALMRAAHRGHRETVEWLIANGADLDRTAKFHLSALMLAIIGRHPEVARALVKAGADTTITGTGALGYVGKTAADIALSQGDKRLAAFIRDRSATEPNTA